MSVQYRAVLTMNDTTRLKAGHDHTINGVRTRVLTVQTTQLGEITHDHAKALGHKGTAAFKRAHINRYDTRWLLNAGQAGRGDQEILDRFNTRWASRSAWLVFYTPAEAPRYLARHPGGTITQDGNADYTSTPSRAIDELEAIDPATQDRYSKQAATRSLETRTAAQAALTTAQSEKKANRRPWVQAA
jgi:hypothetical protein